MGIGDVSRNSNNVEKDDSELGMEDTEDREQFDPVTTFETETFVWTQQ